MATSFDVTLPKNVVPNFPAMCVVCHLPPNSTTKILQNSTAWWSLIITPWAMLFDWSRVEIPVCRRCKWRFKLQRWSREIACWLLAGVAVWLISPYFQAWPKAVRTLAVGILVLIATLPYLLAEVFWARIFDTIAEGNRVNYQFASPEYALVFWDLNSDQVIETDLPPAATNIMLSSRKTHARNESADQNDSISAD